MRLVLASSVVIAACGGTPAPAKPAPARPQPAAPVAACASAEHRQLDFWIGDWDLVVRSKATPDATEWTTAPATQHVESILGGCVISERFVGDGWAGNSYSMWQPKRGRWRQTWVDDTGSYIALDGGVEHGTMTLYGEPADKDGKRVQMRMTFEDVTADTLTWRWQRSVDGGAWTDAMVIDYRRKQ